MAKQLKGIAVSAGVVLGPLVKLAQEPTVITAALESEVKDFNKSQALWHEAQKAVLDFLGSLQKKTAIEIGIAQSEIFLAQQMILEDPSFETRIFGSLQPGMSLVQAIDDACAKLAAEFEQHDNLYMRERADDIRDIGQRLIAYLSNSAGLFLPQLTEPAVLVARDLTPSQTAQLDKNLLLGFVLEKGGRTSHTAILARALGIPAIVAVTDLNLATLNETIVLVDGDSGTLIMDPGPAELAVYQKQLAESKNNVLSSESIAPTAETTDGIKVEIVANIGSASELVTLTKFNVCGVGLCRTEFLFLGSEHLPGEEEQFEEYKKITQAVAPYSIIFRTLDIGGDKKPPYFQLAPEENPFLGLRAIRLSLTQPDVFKTQIRALLRASAYGKIKIMFPMITTVEECQQALGIAAAVQTELARTGLAIDPVEWGIMIEVPAAAVIADFLAEQVDFFSIGTNDLIQYTLAADRLNEQVNYLYQPFHPAVLRLINQIISAGHNAGIPVGMCGEMAGMPEAASLLLGLGLDEFSMNPAVTPRIKQIIQQLSRAEAKTLAAKALQCRNADEVLTLLKIKN